jgi:hypothetical protein
MGRKMKRSEIATMWGVRESFVSRHLGALSTYPEGVVERFSLENGLPFVAPFEVLAVESVHAQERPEFISWVWNVYELLLRCRERTACVMMEETMPDIEEVIDAIRGAYPWVRVIVVGRGDKRYGDAHVPDWESAISMGGEWSHSSIREEGNSTS